jgi:hypothetical protein
MTVSENDLCTLAAIVTAEREDLPARTGGENCSGWRWAPPWAGRCSAR